MMIDETRIRVLNRNTVQNGSYVLYWMQASQRTEYNYALEYAIHKANELKQPLVVYFGLTDRFPEANLRHYAFMVEGLNEVKNTLAERGITMAVRNVSPENGVIELSREASLTVCDRGYLRIQRQWRERAAEALECPLIQVESDVVVPVETASGKEEYSAATLRRKVVPLLPQFVHPVEERDVRIDSTGLGIPGIDLTDIEKVLASLDIDRTVVPVSGFTGGTGQARLRFQEFIEQKLDRYGDLRNDPNEDVQSGMSPYLHFGQISPVYLANALRDIQADGTEAFLEELIVRRELACNFVFYNRDYDRFSGLPDWAKKTLAEHKADPREYRYSRDELENGATHDRYWNAAQKQMVVTGTMHGYLRMYWGKKLLEWSENPETGFDTALSLNNRYSLDGRDPNSFAGVAWCFGKHDRPWARRPVFGNVRYMNANGLKRKFDIEKYAKTWE